MDRTYRRHQRIWKLLQMTAGLLVRIKFDLKHDDIRMEGPVLLISNHVTSRDPLIVAQSLRHKQVYYVASEHLFRKGFLTRILKWIVDPIPRSKGTASGTDTVKACLRHLKQGHSVCIFAEGEQSWDGRNNPVFSATGKLARSSGATLVTYRLEGAYLSLPRWADTIRRGPISGHAVGIYTPEELRTMSPEEITDIMIVAGIGSINLEDIRGLLLPFILLVIAGAVLTWIHLTIVCKKAYPGYYYEGLLSMYGMMTGTISSGVLLLREIDPGLKTPAANNLITGSSFGIILGAPMLIFVGLAPRSEMMCWLVVGLVAVYLAALYLLIFKAKGRKKA